MSQSPYVDELVQRGVAAAREGRHGVAQQALREAVRLAPDNEQAWLWLSGVEDNEKAKLAALREVLRINPQNAAAQRGVDHLSQPKMVDLASLVPTVAPPPARAAWSPPPARAAGAPAAGPPASSFAPPGNSPTKGSAGAGMSGSMPFAPMVEATPPLPRPTSDEILAVDSALRADPRAPEPAAPEAAEQQVAADMVDDLRPAISKAGRARRFWPRVSELVIGAGLLVLLLGGVFGARAWLRQQLPGRPSDNRSLPVARASNAATPRPAPGNSSTQANPTNPPAATPQPTVPVASGVGAEYASRSYSLQVVSASPSQDNRSLIVEVSLRNPSNRVLPFRSGDFQLVNAANGQMTLSAAASSLVSGGGTLSIPAGGTYDGSLVFLGDATRAPFRLFWRPANGGVNQQINLP